MMPGQGPSRRQLLKAFALGSAVVAVDRATGGMSRAFADEAKKKPKKDSDSKKKIKVYISNQRDIDERGVRTIAAAANPGSINLLFYGTDKNLLKASYNAAREAIENGVPIGTIYLAKKMTGEGKEAREVSGVSVYFDGQRLNEELLLNKSEVEEGIAYGEEKWKAKLAAASASANANTPSTP